MSDTTPLNDDQSKILDSIKTSRIVPPILIGLGVVFYLIWQQYDPELFRQISWTRRTIFWLGLAVFVYVIRHMFYAWRLRVLSDKLFSWGKSIELVFLWEFSTAVSPFSVGGAAVALLFLAQEKISAAKTVSIVVYTMIVDTLFFLISLPLLYFIIGPLVVRPGAKSAADLEAYGITFWTLLIFMSVYGAIFFYGVFINPGGLRTFLHWLSNRKILSRFKQGLIDTGNDVVVTSTDVKQQPFSFHFKIFFSTFGAWITRFMAVNFIILALITSVPLDFWNQFVIFGRAEAMHSITQFSPTPGAAGVTEYLFGGFFSDYISIEIAIVVALIWRLITFYPYLLAGVIIIPNWIKNVLNQKRLDKKMDSPKN